MMKHAPTPKKPVRGTGHVSLLGAGPGDPELLTLKALRLLQEADVVLADDLVSDEILALIPAHVRVVHVGKRGGCVSTPQAFIEKLMVQEVLQGQRLVRLKGGDPFILGRGGEEVEALQAAGIEVTVVNGITSGQVALSSLGVPLTHRDHARGVLFITGHTQAGAAPTDWPALAHLAHAQGITLLIYMGVAQAKTIETGLLHGLPGDTPVALVQNASRPEQRHALCTLDALHETLHSQALHSPCIIAVGRVLQDALQAQAPAHSAAPEWAQSEEQIAA
jgi:uroporphyrin-III C-methyltransferase